MNLAQLIVRVRDVLDDSNTNQLKYTDLEIARHVDEQLRALFKTKLRQNNEWSNMTLALQKESARTLFANTYEWTLPTWIEAVRRVYVRSASDGTGETTYSPYRWTVTNAPTMGQEIPKSDERRRLGWTWQGQHVFRLWNWNQAPEINLEVSVTPAPVFKVAIANIPVAPVATSMFLPTTLAASDLGDFDPEEGRYINTEAQVTATTGAADIKLGEIRRVIYSKASTLDVGVRRHQLDFDAAFASNLAVGDTIQSIIPIEPVHLRCLVLRIVNACAQKKFNIDLQKSISAELGQEMLDYVEACTAPRDSNGPFFKTTGSRFSGPYDPNRINQLQGSWP